ncbi:trafficking protein particle complex protein [Chloropicon primus]|uniref:Trafficking protein particle complex subunit 2-like protein n=1 Tax=Chloropicon primus TaxID=1764295 RepID=A0A5B8N0F1_9CHLO|nr:trafficking protein particle complex protein [Chloropicon primus]UPR04961.1 trafficking protein particle complex protein [Chloropicon primus]|eukprot:QDZ25766.1 trafficking protein particle complex protein [Chloropicon primus]
MFACVAVVGPANNPLFVQTYRSDNVVTGMQEDPIKFHYILHCSLDAFEEKASANSKTRDNKDSYLGLLYPTEDYKVYGYLTSTQVKLILVAQTFNAQSSKEGSVKKVFESLHSAYIDAVSNPFYTPGKKIQSKSFEKRVDQIVSASA